MKRTLLFTIAVLALIFYSCKKKDSQETTSSGPDFVKLKTGNYWVYHIYKVDTNGVETDQSKTDSSYIEKDTLINGYKYFLKYSQFYPGLAERVPVRDSSGYLLQYNPNGKNFIIFARDNFSDLLFTDNNVIFNRTYRMTGKDSIVSLPAGTFTTRSFFIGYYPVDNGYPWGERRNYYMYGLDAGLVKQIYIYYTNDPDHYEARLIRYHVE
jgi:hypothetical protein